MTTSSTGMSCGGSVQVPLKQSISVAVFHSPNRIPVSLTGSGDRPDLGGIQCAEVSI